MLIRDLRKEFKTPGMLMTIGECGVGGPGPDKNGFRTAQARTATFPDLTKTVRFVKTAEYWDENEKYKSNAGYHYNGSCRTYYRKGVAFAEAMYDMMPKITVEDLHKHVDEHSKPAYTALKSRQYPKAYSALREFEKVFEANRDGGRLDEDALEMQETVLDILKRQIDGPIDMAVDEIASMKTRGDLYRLSIVYPKYKKAFKGIAKFDEAAGTIDNDLRTMVGRRVISAGRRFHNTIEKLKRVEAHLKGERTQDYIKAYQKLLNKFARQEKNNIYGKAALVAAEKVADPKHEITSANDYVNAVE